MFARVLRDTALLAMWLVVAYAFLAPRVHAQAGVSALPTLYRVPWLEKPERRVRLSLSGAYGYTESVLRSGDHHHGAAGALSVGATSRSGFGAELRGDVRYDKHVLRGKDDDGGVIDPRATLRYVGSLSDELRLGADATLWVPGKEFPSPALSAATIDLRALFGAELSSADSLSIIAGYRMDQSANAVSHPERLSAADFSALGLSSFDALLVGFGLRHALGRGALFGELDADLLIGSGAPSITQSPLRAAVGVEQALNDSGTRGRFALEVGLGSRPRVDVQGALIPRDPRVLLVAAISQDMAREESPPPVTAPVLEPQVEPTPAPEPAPEPEVATAPQGMLRVFVRDTDWGEPIDADVEVLAPGESAPRATGQATKDQDGMLEIEVTPGRYEIRIDAKGYAPQRRNVSIDEGGVTVLNVDLRPKEGRR